MAAPVTPVLDNFNRTESPLKNGTNWSTWRSTITGQTNGTVLQLLEASEIKGAIWHTEFQGHREQAYCDVIKIGSASGWLEVWVGAKTSEITQGYSGEYVPGAAEPYRILRGGGGALEEKAKAAGTALAAGDSLWLDVQENAAGTETTVRLYRKHEGTWTEMVKFVDKAPRSISGFVGFAAKCLGGEWQLDNFGGGEVGEINTEPGNQTNTVGVAITPITLKGTNLHTIASKNLPKGLTLTKKTENEWEIKGTPEEAKAAVTVTLEPEAENAQSGTETVKFKWTIEASSSPPNLVNPRLVFATEGENIGGFPIENTGGVVEAGGWSMSGAPAGLSINSEGEIVGTLGAGTDGKYKIKIKAKNASGTSEVEFELRVTHPHPKLEPETSSQSGLVGSPITPFTLTNTGGTPEASGWSASPVPPGLSINSSTGEITGTPSEAGAFATKVTAKNDGGTGSATVNFTIEIGGETTLVTRHQSIREQNPLHLLIDGEDYSFLLADSFTFSNVDPGGYEMASFGIPKDLPQIQRGAPVKLDCGTQVAWEGRVKEVQRSLGNKTLLQCEGYGAKLRDEDLSMVFVDRDLTRWTGPSRTLEIEELEASEVPVAPSVGVDPSGGLPALVMAVQGPVKGPNPKAEGWYDSGPQNKIHTIYYDYISGPSSQDGGVTWRDFLGLSSTNSGTGTTSLSANINGLSKTLQSFTATAQRFAFLEKFYNAEGGTAFSYNTYYENLALFGNHGLTARGSGPPGLYSSDIVKWVAEQVAGLKVGVIPEASFYVVPHAAYYTPVEAQQIIADMAKLIGCHWGVWESQTYLAGNSEPRLDFRPYPTQGNFTAWAFRRECETLDIREDLSSQYNTAQVTFSEASGAQSAVAVTVDNPVLDAAGITNRTIQLNLGTSTEAAAKAYGKLALELLQQQARVLGSATVPDTIHSQVTGGPMPAWLLKSGIDRLRIVDLPSSDAWGYYNELPITRVECSGSDAAISTNVEFGQGKNLLEALTSELEQASVLAN